LASGIGGTSETGENRLVSLVYVVCLVCLNQPDAQNKPDKQINLFRPSCLSRASRATVYGAGGLFQHPAKTIDV